MFHIQEVENLIYRIQSSSREESKFTRLKKRIRLKRIKAIRAAKGSAPKANDEQIPSSPFDYFS